MKCKYCEAELAEGVTLCPACGKENAGQSVPVEQEQSEFVPDTIEVSASAQTATEETSATETDAPVEQTTQTQSPAEPEIVSGAKPGAGKLALTVGFCVVLLALLVALIVGGLSHDENVEQTDLTETTSAPQESTEAASDPTVPEDGDPDDASCKGTYTASDEEVLAAFDTVVATMEGAQMTNAELQVYYALMLNQFLSTDNFYYLYYYGMFDYTQPLDTQTSAYAENLTWQQYFLQEAINAWHLYQSLAIEADAAGYTLPQEYRDYLDKLPDQIAADALEAGYESADDLIRSNLGSCATLENYMAFQEVYYLGYSYYQSECDKIQPTDDEIEAYFREHEEAYAANGLTKDYKLVDVRHILIMPDGADSSTIRTETFPDEAWEIAEAQAQSILNAWLDGETTEERFAELAKEHSDDGSSTDGGLITEIAEGQMVEAFENWCFDPERKVGDYGIVKSEFGYHVMYFVGDDYKWKEYTTSDIITERGNAMIDAATEAHPMQVDYSAMLLGTIDFGS